MPDGEKRTIYEERVIQLFMRGLISSEDFASLIEEIAEWSEVLVPDADAVPCSPSLSGESPTVPETETELAPAVYVRAVTSSQEDAVSLEVQEAACATLAESLGYQLDDVDVYREVGSVGDADA